MHASLPHLHPSISHRKPSSRAAFSLTELLVVIGIIVLLVGLLLVALGQVQKRAKRTQTEATMRQFLNACTAFQAEHGFYPGVIPEDVLAEHEANVGPLPISSTENALLHLMGGYRVLNPIEFAAGAGNAIFDDYAVFPTSSANYEFTIGSAPNQWHLKVNPQLMGQGPVINGKPYGPYFTPGNNEMVTVAGQVGENAAAPIPDLVDSWGQPIIYLKQARTRGPLVYESATSPRPQFAMAGVKAYLNSAGLGETGRDQVLIEDPPPPDPGTNPGGSILGVGETTGWEGDRLAQNHVLAAILGHQSFYKAPGVGNPLNGSALGAIVLISAGPDGIYFSAHNGPGSPSQPLTAANVGTDVIDIGPRVIDEFDDVRVYGGG